MKANEVKTVMENKPRVSIIIGVMEEKGIDTIFSSLNSFLPQEGNIDFEFIVVDEANEQREKIYRERFPWVKLINTERLMPESYLRNIALQHARCEIIVFTTDHVRFPRCYLKNLVAVFSKGYRIVGGPVANGNPEVFIGWVQYFCEYNKWLPGLHEGVVDDLPGTNFAYHIDLLKRLGPLPEGEYSVETLFHKKAKENGNKLYFCHGLRIEHINEEKISVIWTERFLYGKLFAARRNFPVWKRIIYIVLSPLIALIEYIRIFKNARHDQTCLKKFIQCTPLLFPTLFIWMAGECVGYIGGQTNE
jgi:glycosyltransferase involved in cell wall biosynthesis